MSILEKVKNPNAGAAQIFLALLYIVIVGAFTGWALFSFYAGKTACSVDKINF